MANTYEELIDEVRIIDQDAADYLANGAKDLPDFHPSKYLDEAFAWEDTPQGGAYWARLLRLLRQLRDNE